MIVVIRKNSPCNRSQQGAATQGNPDEHLPDIGTTRTGFGPDHRRIPENPAENRPTPPAAGQGRCGWVKCYTSANSRIIVHFGAP